MKPTSPTSFQTAPARTRRLSDKAQIAAEGTIESSNPPQLLAASCAFLTLLKTHYALVEI